MTCDKCPVALQCLRHAAKARFCMVCDRLYITPYPYDEFFVMKCPPEGTVHEFVDQADGVVCPGCSPKVWQLRRTTPSRPMTIYLPDEAPPHDRVEAEAYPTTDVVKAPEGDDTEDDS